MSFQFTEAHLASYMSEGHTVFRSILPPALIKDLRRLADKGRRIAREKHGPQAQRIQPVGTHFSGDELRPFRDYAQLPPLVDAIKQLIGPTTWFGDPEFLGILLEPAEAPWCTAWHRDITPTSPGVDPAEFEVIRYQREYFNQVNCALYDDSSTWYVPGSHCRDDVPAETAHVPSCPTKDWMGLPASGVSPEEQEVRCLNYCRDMPRAVCLHLGPGDFALYRPNGWHLGNYAPYRVRATLHDAVFTPAVRKWYRTWTERREELAKTKKAG